MTCETTYTCTCGNNIFKNCRFIIFESDCSFLTPVRLSKPVNIRQITA